MAFFLVFEIASSEHALFFKAKVAAFWFYRRQLRPVVHTVVELAGTRDQVSENGAKVNAATDRWSKPWA